MAAAGWDVRALQAIAGVEFENTRNLGYGSRYATLAVPDGGRLFSSLQVNHSYAETDVFVSLCKMKEHATAAGPHALDEEPVRHHAELALRRPRARARTSSATAARSTGQAEGWMRLLPGEKPGFETQPVGVRVPRTIVDENLARPVQLAIVDGIRTIRGGEGWWNAGIGPIDPGVIVAGWNALSTDAVAASVMGFDPRAPHYTAPFETRENHLLLAEQAGVGTADLARIEVRGAQISDVRTPFRAAGFQWRPPAPLSSGPLG